MKVLRVAIVMGGGVSLGSFGGGALSGALSELHRHARTNGLRMQIDVLSGASAGALSLCLLLRRLALPEAAYGPDEHEAFWAAEIEASQHRAWVREIGIERLMERGDEPPGGLLSSALIEDLAQELLAWPGDAPPGEGVLDPRGLLGPRVYLLATLMNLNGIPVVSSRLEGNPALVDAMAATLYRDHRTLCLDLAEGLDPDTRQAGSRHRSRRELLRAETWREMADTCLAAGAFPVAFAPRAVPRARSELGSLWPWRGADTAEALRGNLWFDELEAFPFTYGDGGAFNNEPLREAMALVRSLDDPAEEDAFERVMLYVDPHLSGMSHVEFLDLHYPTSIRNGSETPRTLGERLLGQAGPTVSAIAGQAGFHDVREADRVNQRLEWRDRLRRLTGLLVDRVPEDEVGGLSDEVEEELRRVLAVKGEASMVRTDYPLDRELSRVRAEEGARPEGGPDGDPLEAHGRDPAGRARARLRDALFALSDQVSGLRDRREVRILAVGPIRLDVGGGSGHGPEAVPLAGAFLHRFGGFLHRELREHDFRWGRHKGRRVVAAELGNGPGETPDPLPPWPADEVFEAARTSLVRAARRRYGELVAGALSRFSRWSMGGKLFGGALNTVFRGRRSTGMFLFDAVVRPELERAVAPGRATERTGLVRIRLAVQGAASEGGEELGTWIRYRIRNAEGDRGSESSGPKIDLESGPHLVRAEDGAPFLDLRPSHGGPSLRIPVGPESTFMNEMKRHARRLGGSQTPLFRVEADADGADRQGRAGVRWKLIPNAG